MNPSYEDLPALGALRERLVEAAHEDTAPAVRRTRTWRRRAPAIAFAGLAIGGGAAGLVLGGAAGADSLLATGDPVPESPLKSPRYAPKDIAGRTIALSTVDPEGTGVWAVATYRSTSGDTCAIAGQLRGQTLGISADGRFRPYTAANGGPCGDLRKGMFMDVLYFAKADRTVVYGRAAKAEITLRVKNKPVSARTGRGGAFLFLFSGELALSDVRVPPG